MKTFLLVVGLFICISRSGLDDPHTFLTPEEGVGHVAIGTRVIDAAERVTDACEALHGETCETFCFESRDGLEE